MLKKKPYIIRGTGFPVDGSLVYINKEWEDGYVSVLLIKDNSLFEPLSIKIHKKYLQLWKSVVQYSYSFTLEKHDEEGRCVESTNFEINETIKNISLDTIKEYLELNLTPILRTE